MLLPLIQIAYLIFGLWLLMVWADRDGGDTEEGQFVTFLGVAIAIIPYFFGIRWLF